MTDETRIIHGPVATGPGGSVIYSVTLSNGYIITSPQGFGDDPQTALPVAPLPPREDRTR